MVLPPLRLHDVRAERKALWRDSDTMPDAGKGKYSKMNIKETIPPYLVMDTCCFGNDYKTKAEREKDKENRISNAS